MAHLTKECMKNIALACKEAVEAHEEKYGKDFPFEPQSSWVGLSDDEIDDLAHSCNLLDDYPHKFARAIEQALRNKNT